MTASDDARTLTNVAHVHAVRPPVMPALDELQLPAGQRMERVCHSDARQAAQIRRIRRIRRVDPTGYWRPELTRPGRQTPSPRIPHRPQLHRDDLPRRREAQRRAGHRVTPHESWRRRHISAAELVWDALARTVDHSNP